MRASLDFAGSAAMCWESILLSLLHLRRLIRQTSLTLCSQSVSVSLSPESKESKCKRDGEDAVKELKPAINNEAADSSMLSLRKVHHKMNHTYISTKCIAVTMSRQLPIHFSGLLWAVFWFFESVWTSFLYSKHRGFCCHKTLWQKIHLVN